MIYEFSYIHFHLFSTVELDTEKPQGECLIKFFIIIIIVIIIIIIIKEFLEYIQFALISSSCNLQFLSVDHTEKYEISAL